MSLKLDRRISVFLPLLLLTERKEDIC